jgi:MFS family permease
MGAGFALLSGLDTESTRGAATVAMVVLGIGLGLVLQNLLLVVQNSVPSSELGIATSATQFFRTTGGTIGVSVMGALMTSGLPADAESASPAQLAHAIHPVFMLGIPLMVVAVALILLIPEKPLRRHVREPEPTPVAA